MTKKDINRHLEDVLNEIETEDPIDGFLNRCFVDAMEKNDSVLKTRIARAIIAYEAEDLNINIFKEDFIDSITESITVQLKQLLDLNEKLRNNNNDKPNYLSEMGA